MSDVKQKLTAVDVVANMNDFKNETFTRYAGCYTGSVKYELGFLGNGYWQFRIDGIPVVTNIQPFPVMDEYNEKVPEHSRLYEKDWGDGYRRI